MKSRYPTLALQMILTILLVSCTNIPTPDLVMELTPALTQLPTNTIVPTNTPAPSETPSPILADTPLPVLTCPIATEKSIIEHNQNDARIEEVHYKINGGEIKTIERNGIIELKHGETLEFTQLTYYSNTTLDKDALALEAYYHYDNCKYFHDEDGLFSKGVVLKTSPDQDGKLRQLDNHWEDKNHNPKPGWEIHKGWDKVLVVLVHYYPCSDPDGCFAVEDRFVIQLFVES